MKLYTIWSIHGMSTNERFRRTRDWAALTIGMMLPLRVRYWVTMGELATATKYSGNIPATPLGDVLDNLDRPKSMS